MELFKLEVLYYRKAAEALGINVKQLTQEDCDEIEEALASTQMGYNPIIQMDMNDEPESFAEGGYGDISQIMIDFFTKGIKPDMRAGAKKQTLTPTTFEELEAEGESQKIKFKLGSKIFMFDFDPNDDKILSRYFTNDYYWDNFNRDLEQVFETIYGNDEMVSTNWSRSGGWTETFISRENYEKYVKPIAKQISIVSY